MKNQYFGDINDYRKYGLLRSVLKGNGLRAIVAWMLTPDDDSSDGKFTSYLQSPERWNKHDPLLYYKLKALLQNRQIRSVGLLEGTSLLRGVEYYAEPVPEAAAERDEWFKELLARSKRSDLVFLDPDNGLEIKSCSYGRKRSSKFLYWHEVAALWRAGKSLLIYQHFPRQERAGFVQRMLGELEHATPGSLVEAFATPNVVFLMALRPEHRRFHDTMIRSVQKNWAGQINHRALAPPDHPHHSPGA